MSAGPVPVSAPQGVSAATLVWTFGGKPHVTVVVKIAFTIVPGGVMTPAEPPSIVAADLAYGDRAEHSLRAASDLVPYRPRVDVWITGQAYAPPGAPPTVGDTPPAPVPSWTASLQVLSGDTPLLHKSILVRCDAPTPYMPLLYERAARDPGGRDNPVGVDPAQGRAPNLLDPHDASRPAGFGPISRRWPARRGLLAGRDASIADGPAPALPSDFDWRYFQAAPDDQQLAKLRGDERIVLEGLHPRLPRVESRLPGVSARAWLYGPGAKVGKEIPLRADTLNIDVDRQVCCVTWRGNAAVPPDGPGSLRAVTHVELPNAAPRAPTPRPAAREDAPEATLDVAPEDMDRVIGAPATPFELAAAARRLAGPQKAPSSSRTAFLSSDALARLSRSATPFDAAAQGRVPRPPGAAPQLSTGLPFSPAPPDPPAPPKPAVQATMEMTLQEHLSAALPFSPAPAPLDPPPRPAPSLASEGTMVGTLPEPLASPLPFSDAPAISTIGLPAQMSSGLPFWPAPEPSPPPFVLVPLATPPLDAPAPPKKRKKKKRLKGLGGQFMAAVHDYERQGRGG